MSLLNPSILIKLVVSSSNKKTGKISQTYSSSNTCPTRCPFKNNGCYASSGPCGLVWRKLQNSFPVEDLKLAIKYMSASHMIRHNVAGDMAKPGTSDLDIALVKALVEAYKGHNAYTYTHCEINERNIKIVKWAIGQGFIINFSCENLEQVKKCREAKVPCVLTCESFSGAFKFIDKTNFTKCPSQYIPGMTCAKCGLCSRYRNACIVFEAHGTSKKKAINSGKLLKL